MLRPLDDDFWLGHCQGFEVDTPDGRIGFVEDVVFRTTIERPDTLLIRGGLLGRRLVAVRVKDVGEIAPREERVVLARTPEGLAPRRGDRSHLLARLIASLPL